MSSIIIHENPEEFYYAGYDPYKKEDDQSIGSIYIYKRDSEGNIYPLTTEE